MFICILLKVPCHTSRGAQGTFGEAVLSAPLGPSQIWPHQAEGRWGNSVLFGPCVPMGTANRVSLGGPPILVP